MLNTADKFLKAEQSAVDLVNTLQKLQSEVNSYDTAKNELNNVREDLRRFINSSQEIALRTNEAVRILKEIGGPEIFKKLDAIFQKMRDDNEINAKKLDEIPKKLDEISKKESEAISLIQGIDVPNIMQKIESVDKKISNETSAIHKKIGNTKVFTIINFTFSILILISLGILFMK